MQATMERTPIDSRGRSVTKVAEFVGGPRDGAAIAHDYDTMPKFILMNEDGAMEVLAGDSLHLYRRAADGRYFYMEVI